MRDSKTKAMVPLGPGFITPKPSSRNSAPCSTAWRTSKTKRSISRELVLSENTVKTHIGKIYRKLGINKREELLHLIDEE